MGKRRKKKKLSILRFLMTDGNAYQSDLSDDSDIVGKDAFENAAINSLVSGLGDDELGKFSREKKLGLFWNFWLKSN